MKRKFQLNAVSHSLCSTFPAIIAGLVSLSAFADCGSGGGTISEPTTASCTVSDDNATLTIDSKLDGKLIFKGDNDKVVIGESGELSSTADLITFDMSKSDATWELDNSGKIDNTAFGQDSDLIDVSGENINGLKISITNDGEMVTTGGASINVVKDPNGSLTVNNNANGKITSKGDAAISNKDASLTTTINNAGELSNTGTGTYVINSVGQTVVHNSGTIYSDMGHAISTGDKDDQLIIEPTSSITGDVDFGGGTDDLTLTGDQDTTGTISDFSVYKNFETLTKDGSGTWIVSGDITDFESGTTVKAGNLLLADADTTLESNVTINQDATFGGYGSVKGDVINKGTLAIASAAPGMSGEMSNFTINGNYTGEGGNLVLNMALNGDADTTGSNLIITGDTSGSTSVTINNIGGMGGEAIEGVQVIEVEGKSNGEFVQNGRIVAGAYDYSLVKGNATSNGNWYLTSEVTPDPTPDPKPDPTPDPKPDPTPEPEPTPTPEPTPDPIPDPTPAPAPSPETKAPVRPETGSYLGNQSAAKTMFMSTLHDRMGEQNYTQSLSEKDLLASTWVRTSGSRIESKSAGNIDQQTDISMFQLGNDITSWTTSGNGRVHVGFLFGYGYAKTDSYSAASKSGSRHSTGTAKGYNTGLYGTWYQDAVSMKGLYVDTSLQYSWFDNETQGEGLSGEKYDSDLWQASMETGYTVQLNRSDANMLYVEPQAQVIYTTSSSEDFREQNGTYIHGADSDGYTTRLGLRLFGRQMKETRAIEPFIEANWWHETHKSSIMMNEDRLYDDSPANRYEVKGGVEGKFNDSFHSWANMGYQTGENDYNEITGMVGVKYLW